MSIAQGRWCTMKMLWKRSRYRVESLCLSDVGESESPWTRRKTFEGIIERSLYVIM